MMNNKSHPVTVKRLEGRKLAVTYNTFIKLQLRTSNKILTGKHLDDLTRYSNILLTCIIHTVHSLAKCDLNSGTPMAWR